MNQQAETKKPFSYDNFPLFEEVKRKNTARGIVCLDRVWHGELPGMMYSVTLNYNPIYSPASRPSAEEVYKQFAKEII